MTTRMVHPLHGATHAYDNNEIERLKGAGWAVEAPVYHPHAIELESPALKLAETFRLANEAVAAVNQDYEASVVRKKPGPKPKGK